MATTQHTQAHANAQHRFLPSHPMLSPDECSRIDAVTEAIIKLGTVIEEVVPPGRNCLMALTALEEVINRSRQAFLEDPNPQPLAYDPTTAWKAEENQ